MYTRRIAGRRAGGRLALEAYTELRRRILDGTYPVGRRLPEIELAADLGISRTPVRHALQLLIEDGLAEVGPRRRPVVTRCTPERLREVTRIRTALELLAVEEACVATSVDDLDPLHLLLMRQRRAAKQGRVDDFIDLDEQFHVELAEVARLPVLSRYLHQLRGFVRLMRAGRVTSEEHMLAVVEEHQQLLEAIEARDSARARECLVAHIDAGERRRGRDDASSSKRSADR
jgi:GntR family transcriptional regulator, rspAB operon transcriptional repressor